MSKIMSADEVKAFEADKGAGKEEVKRYGSGTGDAPVQDF